MVAAHHVFAHTDSLAQCRSCDSQLFRFLRFSLVFSCVGGALPIANTPERADVIFFIPYSRGDLSHYS